MFFKNLKPLHKQYDPDGGDGSGGGGGRRIEVIEINVSVPSKLDYKDDGSRSVLLVRLLRKKFESDDKRKIPTEAAAEVVSEMVEEPLDSVRLKIEQSFKDGSRKDIKIGVSDYIKDLQRCLSECFCEKDIQFSVENA